MLHPFALWIAGLAMLAGAASVTATAVAPPKRIPVADFAALPVLSKPMLSPDGRLIAARGNFYGQLILAVLDADRPEAPAKRINLGDTNLAGVYWAGSQRLLLTVTAPRRIGARVVIPYYRLVAVDLWNGAYRPLDPDSRGMYAGDVLYTDPGGMWALVASQDDNYCYPSIKRVNLATGAAVEVEKAREGVWDWFADDKGVVRAGVARDGKRWTLWYREAAGEKLRRIQAKLETDDDSSVDEFIFRGGRNFIVTNERTGRFGLYKYDLAAGAVGEAVFEHPQVDLDDVLYDTATGEVAAVQYQDDRQRVAWLDPEMKALQASLDRSLPGNVNLPVQWSKDKKRVLVWSTSASDPGRYYLLDRATSRMHTVVDPYPRIDASHLAEVKPVRYRARDGLDIPAYLTLPKGRAPRALPLVVLPHGGPFARDGWEYDAIVQFLANRGYAVLQPQFRGSTGYGKAFVSAGFGEWGRRMQDDVDDGVDWLARSGQVDPKRVCIVGLSYGGYAAMWGAIRNPERYRCAASWAGVADLEAKLKVDRRSFSAPRYFREWRTKVAGEGKADPAGVSPVKFAERLKVPLFIAHGEKDDTVPADQSHDMVKALNNAGVGVTSAFYEKSGHDFEESSDFQDWLQKLEAFLTKYNPA